MICYKGMAFCAREGCGKKSCPRNLAKVNWAYGLPVSVADFYGKRKECPKEAPKLMRAFGDMKEGDPDGVAGTSGP